MTRNLETTRLRLRPCTPADVPVLHDLWASESVRRYLFDGRVITSDEARSFVEASIDNFARRGYGLWLASDHRQDELIGFAGLLATDDEAPNLIYGITADHCGQGYATECGAAVLGYALNALGLARVKADVDEPNAASARVLEKRGLGGVGRTVVHGRPLLYYAVSRGRAV